MKEPFSRNSDSDPSSPLDPDEPEPDEPEPDEPEPDETEPDEAPFEPEPEEAPVFEPVPVDFPLLEVELVPVEDPALLAARARLEEHTGHCVILYE